MDHGETSRETRGVSGLGAPDRSDNERAVLMLLRRHGATPAAEIARQVGLSAQSASVITRKLEAEGLVLRGAPARGKVGKPSTPICLNPAGAFSAGLRIGRRRADLILLGLDGHVLAHRTERYRYPTPDLCLDFARSGLDAFRALLGPEAARRLVGCGIGMPFELWNWLDVLGAPAREMTAWRTFHAEDAFADATGLPAMVGNDASLACHGEHLFGVATDMRDFGYIFVGTFLGGGLVIDGKLHLGPGGNAGALASLPVPGPHGDVGQLLEVASLHRLEQRIEAHAPGRAQCVMQSPEWDAFPELVDDWVEETARRLMMTAVTLAAVLDLPAIVVDGSFPAAIRSRLIARIDALLGAADIRGIRRPDLVPGQLGTTACALGAGYRPLVAHCFSG